MPVPFYAAQLDSKWFRMLYKRLLLSLVMFGKALTGQASGNIQSHSLGPDDLISLSVYGAPELTRTFRIAGDGKLTLPMVSKPIDAQGKLPSELESTIAKALRDDHILVSPIVSLTVAEYSSRPITVLGAVRKPLTFQAAGNVTLLDALARAEGLAQDAGSEILFTRDGTSEPIHIPVRKLMVEGDRSLNYQLHGGEQIRVSEAGRVFVVGNVRHPGAFVLRDPADATVLKVLAQAEGLTQFSQSEAVIYRRDRQSGNRTETMVPLKKILERKAPDEQLQADDVLYIPEAKGKRMTAGALDRIIGFGSSTGSMLIWRL